MLVLIDLINTSRCSKTKVNTSTSQEKDIFFHNHHPWIPLPKVIGKTLIFAASRLNRPNVWQMPQGGIDEGEDPRSAAIRELKEETGISSAEVIAEVPYWLTYDWPKVKENLKGQTQKWFLLKFTGKEEEINLLGDGTVKAEFGEWSWMSQEQVVELVVGSKKPVYKEVMTVFAPYFQ